jgi:hypothetical protein
MDDAAAAAADLVINEAVDLAANDAMDTVLRWIGFENAGTRDRLIKEGINTFDDLKTMKEKDIRDLTESCGRRCTAADGCFID